MAEGSQVGKHCRWSLPPVYHWSHKCANDRDATKVLKSCLNMMFKHDLVKLKSVEYLGVILTDLLSEPEVVA